MTVVVAMQGHPFFLDRPFRWREPLCSDPMTADQFGTMLFSTESTVGFAGGDTNLYRRVGNSPINATDPSGNAANLVAGGVGAGAGAILGGVGYYLFTPQDQFTWTGLGASIGVSAAAGGLAGLTFGASLAATGTGFGGFAAASTAAGGVGGMTAGGLGAGVQTGFTDAGAIVSGAAVGGFVGLGAGLAFGVTAGGVAAFLPFGGVAGGAISYGVGGIASDFVAQQMAIGLGAQHGGYSWQRTAFAGVLAMGGGIVAGRYDPSLLGVSGTGSLGGIAASLRNPLAAAGRFVGNTPFSRWLRSPAMVGPRTLEAPDIVDIQRIVEKYGTRIDVGGSRSRAAGRGISRHDLRADKGGGTRSDIDFILDLNHPQAAQIMAELRQVGGGSGAVHPDSRFLFAFPNAPEEFGVLGTRFRFAPGMSPRVIALPVPNFSGAGAGAAGAIAGHRL